MDVATTDAPTAAQAAMAPPCYDDDAMLRAGAALAPSCCEPLCREEVAYSLSRRAMMGREKEDSVFRRADEECVFVLTRPTVGNTHIGWWERWLMFSSVQPDGA